MSKHPNVPKLKSAWKHIFLMFEAKFFMESPNVVYRDLSLFAISFYSLILLVLVFRLDRLFFSKNSFQKHNFLHKCISIVTIAKNSKICNKARHKIILLDFLIFVSQSYYPKSFNS